MLLFLAFAMLLFLGCYLTYQWFVVLRRSKRSKKNTLLKNQCLFILQSLEQTLHKGAWENDLLQFANIAKTNSLSRPHESANRLPSSFSSPSTHNPRLCKDLSADSVSGIKVFYMSPGDWLFLKVIRPNVKNAEHFFKSHIGSRKRKQVVAN